MQVNAVFQGGGVKGIALTGAITVAEQRGFQFHNVAGTSSGAIVASLLAAGYDGEQLRAIIEQTPFATFMGQSMLSSVKVVGPAVRLLLKKGLYSGDPLETWIERLLAAKGIRTFGDLRPQQLRIIASDISQGKLLVLPDDIAKYGIDPLQLTVARAVRMSASLPFFFDPVVIHRKKTFRKTSPLVSNLDTDIYIVDGGVLSNFPLWIFDDEQHGLNRDRRPTPTIGFQLVGRAAQKPRHIGGPLSMLQAMFTTMMDAHDERFIEKHNEFRTIKISTMGVRTTDFDLSKEESSLLFESGVRAASKFFQAWSYQTYVAMAAKWGGVHKI
ncbi:patatin-like phospholipase family protein [Paenibacillus cymbidii]|uniref:patatin-like phospholipase family protein n=1 Tax=Paenibacillus cymbidii TaxID=1639034 RepID=UPI0010800A37|nr:patatin-like phospholipase family protein [Paenibacillus cymbidii]